jgi:hypothetical protein
MNKFLIVILVGLLIVCCESKENSELQPPEDREVIIVDEENEFNPEEVEYKGAYKGEINGKEVELIIKDETFNISVNGRKANGNWQKVNDGSIMGLEVKNGSIAVKNYAYSDPDTWVALTDSLTYFEPEQYLKRVK